MKKIIALIFALSASCSHAYTGEFNCSFTGQPEPKSLIGKVTYSSTAWDDINYDSKVEIIENEKTKLTKTQQEEQSWLKAVKNINDCWDDIYQEKLTERNYYLNMNLAIKQTNASWSRKYKQPDFENINKYIEAIQERISTLHLHISYYCALDSSKSFDVAYDYWTHCNKDFANFNKIKEEQFNKALETNWIKYNNIMSQTIKK